MYVDHIRLFVFKNKNYLAYRMTSEFSSSKLVDLTHVINDQMPTWIENQGFKQKQIFFVEKDGYAIHTLTFEKAGVGTHFDSAAHFFAGKRTVHEYPIDELICSLAVVNVSQHVERDRDYRVTKQDILNWEQIHGEIKQDSFIVANTGWTKFWSSPKDYMNFDENGVRHFPGWGQEAAEYLLDKGARGLGIDTASIDPGNDSTFAAHGVFLKADRYLVENIKLNEENLQKLPETGATIFIMPLPLENGSESPARIFARV